MTVKLLTEHHLEIFSLKGGYTGSSESTYVKMPHCWKSHVAAHFQTKMRNLMVRNLLQNGNVDEIESPGHQDHCLSQLSKPCDTKR